MLVLTRQPGQAIFLDFSSMTDAELLSLRTLPTISITCVSVRGDKVKLGFEAPPPVRIRRDDLSDAAIPAGSSSNSLASS